MACLLEWAQQELINKRTYYDSEFGKHVFGKELVDIMQEADFFKINWWVEPFDHVSAMQDLLEEEAKSELKIRREAVKGYITQQGLAKYEEDILRGMNKTAKRVAMHDDSQYTHLLIHRAILQHDSFALLEFAFDYVDRFKMYNELFGEKKE